VGRLLRYSETTEDAQTRLSGTYGQLIEGDGGNAAPDNSWFKRPRQAPSRREYRRLAIRLQSGFQRSVGCCKPVRPLDCDGQPLGVFVQRRKAIVDVLKRFARTLLLGPKGEFLDCRSEGNLIDAH
jgi:hypothetical protein